MYSSDGILTNYVNKGQFCINRFGITILNILNKSSITVLQDH